MSERSDTRTHERKATMTKTSRWLALVFSVVTASALLTPGGAGALPVPVPRLGIICTTDTVFNLVARTGYQETPDGNSIFMWSFTDADAPDADHPTGGTFQTPGPILCVTEGVPVTVNLQNDLAENVSIVFPGQDGQVTASGGQNDGLFTREATPGNSVSYTFTPTQPGTYTYESGSNQSMQLEMGLYGAIVVRPTMGANFAYNDSTTQFDPAREYVLILSEIDPDLHHAVETGGAYDFNLVHNRYFEINGREFPDTVADNAVAWLPNQPYGSLVRVQPYAATNLLPAMIRIVNLGELNHPFHPHGNHVRFVAQDGRLLLAPNGDDASSEHFGTVVAAGQTRDFLFRWTDQDSWDPNGPTTFPGDVSNPNYRNLMFKDGNTFYSGSAYLGRKGTLPSGVVSQNICGEWYYPWHSHALNEFTNFDEAFGGMSTLLRVDPLGGCFAFPTSTSILSGVLKTGSGNTYARLSVDNTTSATSYYQVNPRTTARTTATTATQTTNFTVASATGFPTAPGFYVRIDNEVVQVTGIPSATNWSVARGQLGTTAATHLSGATVSALSSDWYAGFTGVATGAQNLTVNYAGKNCGVTTTVNNCPAVTTNLPELTVKICNWTVSGVAGCSTPTSNGWVTLPPPLGGGPAQPQAVGSTDVSSTWSIPNPAAAYIGTGSYKGQVRLLIHTQRFTTGTPTTTTPFSSWGNFAKLVYDAP